MWRTATCWPAMRWCCWGGTMRTRRCGGWQCALHGLLAMEAAGCNDGGREVWPLSVNRAYSLSTPALAYVALMMHTKTTVTLSTVPLDTILSFFCPPSPPHPSPLAPCKPLHRSCSCAARGPWRRLRCGATSSTGRRRCRWRSSWRRRPWQVRCRLSNHRYKWQCLALSSLRRAQLRPRNSWAAARRCTMRSSTMRVLRAAGSTAAPPHQLPRTTKHL